MDTMECSKQKKLMDKFWYKIFRIFGELVKCLRMLQLYQNKCPNYTQLKELKGVAEMRSKMCSHNQNKLSKDHSCWKMHYLESKWGFGSLCIWPNSSTKVCKSFLSSTQKEQPNLQKSERKKQNKLWQAS